MIVVASSPVPAYRTSTSMPVSSVNASTTGWTKFSLRPEYRVSGPVDASPVVVSVAAVVSGGAVASAPVVSVAAVVVEPPSPPQAARRAITATRAVKRRTVGFLPTTGVKLISTIQIVQTRLTGGVRGP